MILQREVHIRTSGHRDIHDITSSVDEVVRASGVSTGLVNIHNVGSTGSVGTIEFEPGLGADLPEILDTLIPPGRHYGHEQAWHDGNAHSHLQATLLGQSLSLPVASGRSVRGTWQQIFFLECDTRPRERTLVITVLGE